MSDFSNDNIIKFNHFEYKSENKPEQELYMKRNGSEKSIGLDTNNGEFPRDSDLLDVDKIKKETPQNHHTILGYEEFEELYGPEDDEPELDLK